MRDDFMYNIVIENNRIKKLLFYRLFIIDKLSIYVL